jgi:hypothetical protein
MNENVTQVANLPPFQVNNLGYIYEGGGDDDNNRQIIEEDIGSSGRF